MDFVLEHSVPPRMSGVAKKAVAPPQNASDAEVLDWFLNHVRLTGPPGPLAAGPKDIRGPSLSSSLVEFFTKMAAIVPSAEDVKTPFDYWSFIETVFSPGLRASLIPDNGQLATPPIVTEARDTVSKSFPHYSWSWAVEDCLNLDQLSPAEIGKIKASIPVLDDRFSQVSMDLAASLAAVDKTSKEAAELMAKLNKWLKQTEKSEFAKLRTTSLSALLAFAETLIVELQHTQLLDSIEELHRVDTNDQNQQAAVVIDDGERVRCYLTSCENVAALLQERDSILEGPQTESVQYKYPFSARQGGACPRLPQLGPFCHMCRQAKQNMAKCTNKLTQFYGDSKDGFKSVCHRRFCQECLVAYSWPKPDVPQQYKCPLCAKLCTCDRCVRNVFLKSVRMFITGLRAESATNQTTEAPPLIADAVFVKSVYDFFTIVGELSAFVVTPATPSLESPTSEGAPAPLAGRVKRQASSTLKAQKSFEDEDVKTTKKGKKSGSKPTSALLEPKESEDPIKMEDEDESENAYGNTPGESTSPFDELGDTPPSDRKRRKAASVATTLFRNQYR